MNHLYSLKTLKNMGIKMLGDNIAINKSVMIYNPTMLSLANNIRIDNFTILSGNGKIYIDNYVHISSSCLITSSDEIHLKDFAAISSGVKLFGSNDDYGGKYLIGPTIPEIYKNIKRGKIIIGKYCTVGANSIVLPDVTLNEGCIVGSLSFVKKSLDPWKIYAGNPLKCIKDREKQCIELGEKLMSKMIK